MLADVPFLALAFLGPATLTVAPPKADPPPHEHQLTPLELEELRALAEAERRRTAQSRPDRCYTEETERAGGKPSALDRQAIELKCNRIGAPLK